MIGPLPAFTPTVSVVVLSHRRPHLLGRVLRGISQLDYPAFEVVVVGDQPALASYGITTPPTGTVRYAHYAAANICGARNRALALSGGDFIAFCDDDAVPQPDWLTHLIAPFAARSVGAVGGTVIASDGVGVEWQGGRFDRAAVEHPYTPVDSVSILGAQGQHDAQLYGSIMGANCAFRARALRAIGGFDEAYRYFLDETDAAIRLADAGWSIALARDALVHHYTEENAVRGHLRTPRNVHEIAASKAYFCKRHLPKAQLEDRLLAFRTARRVDLDPYIRLGLLRRNQRDLIEAQIDDGLIDGLDRDCALAAPGVAPKFLPFAGTPDEDALSIALVTGWGLGRVRRLRRAAAHLAEAGHRVSCFSYMTGRHPPTVRYENGVWMHRGGTWRLDRRPDGRLLIGRAARAETEIARTMARRRFDVILRPASAEGRSPDQLLRLGAGGGHLHVQPTSTLAHPIAQVMARLQRSLDDAAHTPARALPHSGPDHARNPTLISG